MAVLQAGSGGVGVAVEVGLCAAVPDGRSQSRLHVRWRRTQEAAPDRRRRHEPSPHLRRHRVKAHHPQSVVRDWARSVHATQGVSDRPQPGRRHHAFLCAAALLLDALVGGRMFVTIFINRLMAGPGVLTAAYFNVFEDMPKYHWAHSFLSPIFDSPYALPPGNVVGRVFQQGRHPGERQLLWRRLRQLGSSRSLGRRPVPAAGIHGPGCRSKGSPTSIVLPSSLVAALGLARQRVHECSDRRIRGPHSRVRPVAARSGVVAQTEPGGPSTRAHHVRGRTGLAATGLTIQGYPTWNHSHVCRFTRSLRQVATQSPASHHG